MKRVTLIPSHRMTLFGPRITIYTKDGKHYTKQSTGREFTHCQLEEEAHRIRDVIPGLPIQRRSSRTSLPPARNLDRRQIEPADLVDLTLARA